MNVDRKKNAERVREHKIERAKGEEEERHLGKQSICEGKHGTQYLFVFLKSLVKEAAFLLC